MDDKNVYNQFIAEIENNVLANIDRAFHGVVARCNDAKLSAAYCSKCAEYLKNRLNGYIDAQAALIGQADPDRASYVKLQK